MVRRTMVFSTVLAVKKEASQALGRHIVIWEEANICKSSGSWNRTPHFQNWESEWGVGKEWNDEVHMMTGLVMSYEYICIWFAMWWTGITMFFFFLGWIGYDIY